MKSVYATIVAALVISLMSGCSLFTATEGGSSEDGGDAQAQYDKMINSAEATYKEVDQMGGAWAYTDELISDAKKMATEKKFNEALELAKEALAQAKAAQSQFDDQKKAGPYLF